MENWEKYEKWRWDYFDPFNKRANITITTDNAYEIGWVVGFDELYTYNEYVYFEDDYLEYEDDIKKLLNEGLDDGIEYHEEWSNSICYDCNETMNTELGLCPECDKEEISRILLMEERKEKLKELSKTLSINKTTN